MTNVERSAPTTAKRALLFVDDEEHLLDSMSRYAKAFGIDVHIASSAEAALARFKSVRPTLVISDYNLGAHGMNGLHLLAEMRRWEPSARLVLLTGDIESLAEVDVPAGTVDRVLSKGDGFVPVADEIRRYG